MLAHLSIRNFAIIDATELEFGPGLNALTGQTGAGKSIIVDAIGLVLGERARADLIREGCRRAEVSALFLLPPSDVIAERLQSLDLLVDSAQTDTTELVIRRTITQGGKGRVYINGSLSTLRTLIDLTRGIIDISSQHAHTSLLKPGTHLALLDRFGELTKERHSYATIWRKITAARGKCDALKHRMEHQLEQEDFLRFQLSELEALAPDPERDQGLEDERKQLRMSDKHHGGYKGAESSLNNGPGSACDSLDSALLNLEPILEDQALLTPILKRLRSARI